MKTRTQTDFWIYSTALVLGVILVTSFAGIIVLLLIRHSLPGILFALGAVAGAGLANLWVSPLNRGLL